MFLRCGDVFRVTAPKMRSKVLLSVSFVSQMLKELKFFIGHTFGFFILNEELYFGLSGEFSSSVT